jgi:hypothetical protein
LPARRGTAISQAAADPQVQEIQERLEHAKVVVCAADKVAACTLLLTLTLTLTGS